MGIFNTQKEDDKQNSDHPISKDDTESDSNADAQHEHWLKEQSKVIINYGQFHCWMPQPQIVKHRRSCRTHDHTCQNKDETIITHILYSRGRIFRHYFSSHPRLKAMLENNFQ